MQDDVAAIVERLARLELALADERQARQTVAAAAAASHQALERVRRDLADAVGRLDARLLEAADRQRQADEALDAARTWLRDLTRHLEAAQHEANGWARAEQSARTVLEHSFLALRERQDATEQDVMERPLREGALRAEVTALGRLVDDLATLVFPVPDGQGD